MEETREDSGSLEAGTSGIAWWSSNFIEKFRSVSLGSQDETLSSEDSRCYGEQDEVSSQTESQILWRTGTFSGPLCNGFYSVIPENIYKELFGNIPSPDELYALGVEGLRAEIILVDTEKDKKLCMLKNLIVALAKGLNSNPPALIKKIAGLDVGQSILESYSRVMESLAFNIMERLAFNFY